MLILIIIEIIVALLLIILILLQSSDNEALGLGGGGNLGGLMSARGSANLLSRATAAVATLFMIMSVILTIVASNDSERKILDSLPELEGSINKIDENIVDEPTIPDTN